MERPDHIQTALICTNICLRWSWMQNTSSVQRCGNSVHYFNLLFGLMGFIHWRILILVPISVWLHGVIFSAGTVSALSLHTDQVSAEWTLSNSDDAWRRQYNEYVMKQHNCVCCLTWWHSDDLKELILIDWLLLHFFVKHKSLGFWAFFWSHFLKGEMKGSCEFGKIILKWGARLPVKTPDRFEEKKPNNKNNIQE